MFLGRKKEKKSIFFTRNMHLSFIVIAPHIYYTQLYIWNKLVIFYNHYCRRKAKERKIIKDVLFEN